MLQYTTTFCTKKAYSGFFTGNTTAKGPHSGQGKERQLRRTTRKVMKGAENAVLQLDRMVGDFVEKHMDS